MAEQILFFLIVGALVLWFASKNAKTPKRRGIYLGILIAYPGILGVIISILSERMRKNEYSNALGEEWGLITALFIFIGAATILYWSFKRET